MRLGVVDASGRRVALTLAGSNVELTYDGCSQADTVVVPQRVRVHAEGPAEVSHQARDRPKRSLAEHPPLGGVAARKQRSRTQMIAAQTADS